MADEVVVLNNWPEIFRLKQRTRSTKQYVTIDVKSESLGVVVSEQAFAQVLADAFIKDLKDIIRNGSSWASLTTQRFRKRAREAFEQGADWAMDRYAGGRLGSMPPNQTKRDLLDSGRLVEGLVATATKDASTVIVNAPANRLNNDGVRTNTMRKLGPLIEKAATSGKETVAAAAKIAKMMVKKGRMSSQPGAGDDLDRQLQASLRALKGGG